MIVIFRRQVQPNHCSQALSEHIIKIQVEAEKAAWAMSKELGFKLVVINPTVSIDDAVDSCPTIFMFIFIRHWDASRSQFGLAGRQQYDLVFRPPN